MAGLDFLEAELDGLRARSLLRTTPDVQRELGLRVLCSNDYLGLGRLRLGGVGAGGAGASALVSGYGAAHRDAEASLSRWLGTEAALLFSSGYAANLGTIAALVGPGDEVYSDELNHASIIDGCRLSGARVVVFPHGRVDVLSERLAESKRAVRRRLIVSESYFSMDGRRADVRALARAAANADAALMIDEAHALGVFGPAGRGVCAEEGVAADVVVGTLGKSFGLQGAFVAGKALLRDWLWNRARSFVFSTAMSPAIAEAVPSRVERVAAADTERTRLGVIGELLRERILELGGRLPTGSVGPIVPWLLGTEERALRGSERLRVEGFLVKAIRPPTVPVGGSRLRFTVDAGLSDAELEALLAALRRVAELE